MSSNRVTLAQLREMHPPQLRKLPLTQIAMLLEDVADLEAQVKASKATLTAELHTRFADRAAELRHAQGKDTGTVSFEVDGCKVSADLPKRASWDQPRLREAVKTIESWGETIEEYASVDIKVSERAYNTWPSSIRKVFEPARVVNVGSPSYKVEIMEAAHA